MPTEIRDDKTNLLHSVDSAAYQSATESSWFYQGRRHRLDGSARTTFDQHGNIIGKEYFLYGFPSTQEEVEAITNSYGRVVFECANPSILDEDTVRIYDQSGNLHNDLGPAVRRYNGTKEWYFHGELHNEFGPAKVYADKTVAYYLNGVNLTEDVWKEAINDGIYPKHMTDLTHGRFRVWKSKNYDVVHRSKGPAMEYDNGDYAYSWYGRYHNALGPAIKRDGKETYYLDGIEVSNAEWEMWTHCGALCSIDNEDTKQKFGSPTIFNNDGFVGTYEKYTEGTVDHPIITLKTFNIIKSQNAANLSKIKPLGEILKRIAHMKHDMEFEGFNQLNLTNLPEFFKYVLVNKDSILIDRVITLFKQYLGNLNDEKTQGGFVQILSKWVKESFSLMNYENENAQLRFAFDSDAVEKGIEYITPDNKDEDATPKLTEEEVKQIVQESFRSLDIASIAKELAQVKTEIINSAKTMDDINKTEYDQELEDIKTILVGRPIPTDDWAERQIVDVCRDLAGNILAFNGENWVYADTYLNQIIAQDAEVKQDSKEDHKESNEVEEDSSGFIGGAAATIAALSVLGFLAKPKKKTAAKIVTKKEEVKEYSTVRG